MNSKQWHYSLHRDFQNCYSTRRSPTGFFKLQLQFQLQLQLQFYKGYPYTIHPHTSTHPENSPFRHPILHAEDKELFEYYTTRNSTHRRQGDLLEMHPCVTFQAVQPQVLTKATPVTPVTPDTPETFQTFQSFMTFQPLQAILQILHCSSISRDSTPFQHSPTRMHVLQFLQFDWFPQKLHRVPVEHLQTFLQTITDITFFKEREML